MALTIRKAHMKKYVPLIAIACFGMMLVGDPNVRSATGEDTTSPAQVDKKTADFAKAFAAAQAEVKKRVEIAMERVIVEAKRRAEASPLEPGGMPSGTDGAWPSSYPPRGTHWPTIAAENRVVAEKLAKEQGKAIVPYLVNRMEEHVPPRNSSPRQRMADEDSYAADSEARFLAFLTLDSLGMHDEAATLGAKLFRRGQPNWHDGETLLQVSFCSAKTRGAIANLLAKHMLEEEAGRFPDLGQLSFLVAAGNGDTAKILDRRLRELKPLRALQEPYRRAINQLDARLSLPKKEQDQRARDAILFWQALCNPTPRTLSKYCDSLAECLAAQKLTISSAYLVEQIETEDADFFRRELAFSILAKQASQKGSDAVSALVGIARRIPTYRDRVEHLLKGVDTPEAKRALQELPGIDGAKNPEGRDGEKRDRSD